MDSPRVNWPARGRASGRTRGGPAPRPCARPRGWPAGDRRGSARRSPPRARTCLRRAGLRRARSRPAPRAATPASPTSISVSSSSGATSPLSSTAASSSPSGLASAASAASMPRALARQQIACLGRVHRAQYERGRRPVPSRRHIHININLIDGENEELAGRSRQGAQTALERIASATARGSSKNGTCPAPSETWRARGSIARARGACSAVGQQAVVHAPRDRQRDRAVELLRLGEGVAVEGRERRRRARGRPRRCAGFAAAPRPASASASRTSARTARCVPRACPTPRSAPGAAARGMRASARSDCWLKRRSAAVQKPTGEIAQTERTAPAPGELERDPAAHRVARHVRALEAELGEERREASA